MGAGVDQHLGVEGVVLGELGAPGATMHVDIDRRVRRLGRIEVERLDRRRP